MLRLLALNPVSIGASAEGIKQDLQIAPAPQRRSVPRRSYSAMRACLRRHPAAW